MSDDEQTITTIVTFYPEKYVPPIRKDGSIYFDNVKLNAGENRLTTPEIHILDKHPNFYFWVDRGVIEIGDTPMRGDTPIDLETLATSKNQPAAPTPTPEKTPKK